MRWPDPRGADRRAYLQEACGEDETVRTEVESLLAQDPSGAGFLEAPQSNETNRGLPLVGTRLGNYTILRRIGSGGMGEVYRAHDATLNRDVAVKVLLPSVSNDQQRLAPFGREAQVLASLNHPSVASVYGWERHDAADGGPPIGILIMELVTGDELAERIARGPIPLPEALSIARQVAEALEAAHERGIVHRDLKPANIKVRQDGTVKVLDFGLAKALERFEGRDGDVPSDSTTIVGATQAGMIVGTPAYMSPEQARGAAVDTRADLWSFGVVLYQMLAGRSLFTGCSTTEILAQVLTTDPDWTALPADTPTSVHRLLRRCLQKDPKRRLDSAAAAGLEIEEAVAAVGNPSPAPGSKPSRLRRGLTRFAAALAVGATVGALMWSRWPTVVPAAPVRVNVAFDADAGLRQSTAAPPQSCLQMGTSWRSSPSGGMAHPHYMYSRLDQLDATVLPGTEGAHCPFFSPDGEWLGFFADAKLKKVSVGGQPWRESGHDRATHVYECPEHGRWVLTANRDCQPQRRVH